MTRARSRFDLPPRGLTDHETAGHLGLGDGYFKSLLPKLEAEGFPKPDPLTGRRDFKAIERWMDARAGIDKYGGQDDGDDGLAARLEAMTNGKDPSAASPR